MTVFHVSVVFIALGGQTRYKAHLGRQPQAALVSFALQLMYLGLFFYGLCFSLKYSFKHINLISTGNSFKPSLRGRACCNVCHELAFSLFGRGLWWNVCGLFSYISCLLWNSSRAEPTLLRQLQKVGVLLCVSPLPEPEATRTIFDLEAGMSFWALDYQNPAHFNVVSILTEKGHCYRLNNLRRCKKETACVHVPSWCHDPFGNGLIHLAGKWENRDDYLWRNLSSFERSRTDVSLQTPVHLSGMHHRRKGCD